jgi:hypothetical protein
VLWQSIFCAASTVHLHQQRQQQLGSRSSSSSSLTAELLEGIVEVTDLDWQSNIRL